MALSEYEERVLANLEDQFRPPAWNHPLHRVAVPLLMLTAGAALVGAGQHAGLSIWISNAFGFATGSITLAFALTGFAVLVVAAFLFGQAAVELRRPAPRWAEAAFRPGPLEQAQRP